MEIYTTMRNRDMMGIWDDMGTQQMTSNYDLVVSDCPSQYLSHLL